MQFLSKIVFLIIGNRFRGLLMDLGFEQKQSTVIYQDNAPLLHITQMQSTPSRTRHLMNRINFIKQEIENGTGRLVKIPDGLMAAADSLTKLLPVNKHLFCTNILVNGHDGILPEDAILKKISKA